MKKLLLIPLVALSLVCCGRKEDFYIGIPYFDEGNIGFIECYDYGIYYNGSALFDSFELIFFKDKKSVFSFNMAFSSYDFSYQFYTKFTFNYTDYEINNETIYFYGDEVPKDFCFKSSSKDLINLQVRDYIISLDTNN